MIRVQLLIALALIGAACSSTSQPTPDIAGHWQLVTGTVAGQPIPLVEASPITLRFEGSNVSGTSACNQYGGPINIDGSTITFGDLFTTLMGCEPEVMASESAYTEALGRVDTVAIEGDSLVLTGPETELRFEPVA